VCTLAVYTGISRRFPIAVAANRDEWLARPTMAPSRRRANPEAQWIFCGSDAVAGGTWLGVNQAGLVAGIVNRRTGQAPDATKRSRGELCILALQQTTLAAATEAIRRQAAHDYNPFHLFVGSVDGAAVIGNKHERMVCQDLPPGVHLLTNLDLNDPTCPRIAKSRQGFAAAAAHLCDEAPEAFVTAARVLLSDHSTPLDPRAGAMPNNLCVHGDGYGTRSSSVIVFDAMRGNFRYWHAEGPPCRTNLVEVALDGACDETSRQGEA